MLRFAINSTKNLNINDLRLALLNYIRAKQKNEDFIIRIDDTEKSKDTEGFDKQILELISLFSFDYKGAVNQSDNLKYHQKIAMQLMSQKKAFACFCSEEKLNQLKEEAKNKGKVYSYDGFCSTLSDETVLNCNAPFTVRIQKADKNIEFDDLIKGKTSFKPFELDSFFILNHEKLPTKIYASAIDDMLYNISSIIKEDTELLNTAREIYVRNQLSYDIDIEYIHISSLKNSSSEGNISIKSLLDEGILPAAIANYLVLLGNETPKEIFTLEEAIEWFDINKISKDEVLFNIEDLKALNKKHLEQIDNLRLSKLLGFADEDLGALAKLFLSDCSTLNELKENMDLIFNKKKNSLDDKNYDAVKNNLLKAPFFEDLSSLLSFLNKKTDINNEDLEKSLAFIIKNKEGGPTLSRIYPLIKNYLGEIVK